MAPDFGRRLVIITQNHPKQVISEAVSSSVECGNAARGRDRRGRGEFRGYRTLQQIDNRSAQA